MILFVFEGEKREPRLFHYISKLYDIREEIVCTYNANLYELYQDLEQNDDRDLFSALKIRSKKSGNTDLDSYCSSNFGQIYLFFDYDPQQSSNTSNNNSTTLNEFNLRIKKLLDFFDEETEHGKLYINYPMVEAIRYTKTLPDAKYHTYTIECDKCKGKCFKSYAHNFSAYKSLNFLSNHNGRENWEHLKRQNVEKANFICNGELCFPKTKADIAQDRIFDSQLEKFVIPKNEVSILSAFPVFLFDYFK